MPDYVINTEQKKAILHGMGPAMVLAGPGSGKTLVLTHRIRTLILKHHIHPDNILTITFTKAAALEMKKRAVEIEKQAAQAIFGTFHSIFFQILKTSIQYSDFSILTEGEKQHIATEILYHTSLLEEDMKSAVSKAIKEINYVRTNGISIEAYESSLMNPELFREIYKEYEKELLYKRKMDFDGILLLCYEYLSHNHKDLSLWQKRFEFVLIDEFQDINELQYRIIRLLTKNHGNLFVVGDDDQAIYGFRGSNPSFMKTFLKDYPNAIQILLQVNYRSYPQIVETAGKSISHNRNRFPKQIVSGKEPDKEKEAFPVMIKTYREEKEEMDFIVREIRNSLHAREEIALLFRTNQKAGLFGEKLFLNGIDYTMKEKTANFYDHFLIQDILAYLKFVHIEPRRAYFYQFMNKPVRYIRREAVKGELVDFGELYIAYFGKKQMLLNIRKLETDLKFLKTLDAYSGISYVLKAMGYEAYGKTRAKGNMEQWKEQEEILNAFMERAKEFKSCKDFLFFIEQYSICFKQEENQKKRGEKGKGVQLMTYHGSKGLEFAEVYLPSVNHGVVPFHKAITAEEIEEERRMFYVAMTRAKEKLCITAIENSSSKRSVFLEELQ